MSPRDIRAISLDESVVLMKCVVRYGVSTSAMVHNDGQLSQKSEQAGCGKVGTDIDTCLKAGI